MFKKVAVKFLMVSVLVASALPALAEVPNDRAALQGVKTGKGLFDINISEAGKLPLYLQVIKETHAALKAQGVKPKLIVAFRGPAVQLVSTTRPGLSADQQAALTKSDALIHELARLGVKFEVCALAARLFGVDTTSILPGIEVVGNTFVSLIGYQSKGYALIPIQ
jgi:intracellular sulfur oxidation DsrE/DsrF family protein